MSAEIIERLNLQHISNQHDFEKKLSDWEKRGHSVDDINHVKNLIVEGVIDDDIAIYLINEGNNITIVRSVLELAHFVLRNSYSFDKTDIISEHIGKYNKEIKRLREYVPIAENHFIQMQMQSQAYLDLFDVMLAKEKLVGLHMKKTNIKLNNNTNVSVKKKESSFDLSKLTLQEKIEFLNLLSKAELNENEINPIILRKDPTKESVVEDIDFEEIKEKENVPNVSKIETIVPEKPIEIKEWEDPMIQIEEKIRENLRKKAEEEFKKIKQKK